ncbi:MAG: peptidylprolyl isomerase [Burkholderiales bacterium]|nr:peptidylprolyl isomerase [Burkholderiales bacterium]
MVTSIHRLIPGLVLLAAALSAAHAQDTAKPVATVNGRPVSQAAFDQALARALNQGGVDTPALRAAVKSQLIARELFAQEAKKRQLDRDPAVAAAVEEARINAMVARYLNEAIRPKPVTEEDVRAQYERIKATLGPEEYKLRLIVSRDRARADEALAGARLGRSFAALAQQYSVAPSARRGGELDWVSFRSPATEGRTNGLPLVVAQAVEKMRQGDVSEVLPLNDQWLIVRLEERRPTVVPTFEQARAALRNMLAARELERATTELVGALVKEAQIAQ